MKEQEKAGPVTKWFAEDFKRNPQKYGDPLKSAEKFYSDYYGIKRVDPKKLEPTAIKEARSMFGDSDAALGYYAQPIFLIKRWSSATRLAAGRRCSPTRQ